MPSLCYFGCNGLTLSGDFRHIISPLSRTFAPILKSMGRFCCIPFLILVLVCSCTPICLLCLGRGLDVDGWILEESARIIHFRKKRPNCPKSCFSYYLDKFGLTSNL